MKPREFDDLVRDKFDQGDFAYNPRNWERLADQMDGRKKNRGLIAWLGLPLAGMAASVALGMGVSTLLRQGVPDTHGAGKAQSHVMAMASAPAKSAPHAQPAQRENANTSSIPKNSQRDATPVAAAASNNNATTTAAANIGGFHIKLNDKAYVQAATGSNYNTSSDNNFNSSSQNKTPQQQPRKKIVLVTEGYNTFKDEPAVKRPAHLSVILSGGVSRGNNNSGYMAGATLRHMINDRVYIESDVAFTSSSNTQMTSYEQPLAVVAKITGKESLAKVTSEPAVEQLPSLPTAVIKHKEVSYNQYYAQVTPSIGYKIMKRMSIGAGPDFQKALVDNRPAPSTVERGTIQVAPLFDIGLMGKTEYAIAKQVKAAVVYRKGINNVITPMGKYIDRDYLQFQVKCTIFNK